MALKPAKAVMWLRWLSGANGGDWAAACRAHHRATEAKPAGRHRRCHGAPTAPPHRIHVSSPCVRRVSRSIRRCALRLRRTHQRASARCGAARASPRQPAHAAAVPNPSRGPVPPTHAFPASRSRRLLAHRPSALRRAVLGRHQRGTGRHPSQTLPAPAGAEAGRRAGWRRRSPADQGGDADGHRLTGGRSRRWARPAVARRTAQAACCTR